MLLLTSRNAPLSLSHHTQAASGSAPVSSRVVSERYSLPEAASTRLVIVNGALRPELSNLSGLPQGVYLGSIQGAPPASAAILVRGIP